MSFKPKIAGLVATIASPASRDPHLCKVGADV